MFRKSFLILFLSLATLAAQAASNSRALEAVQASPPAAPAQAATVPLQQSTLLLTEEIPVHQKLSFDHKGLPTILWYFAPWCGYCKTMYPLILELEKRYTTQLYIVVVDMDDKRNAELIKKYRGEPGPVPLTQFYDKEGNYIEEHLGALAQPEMFGILSTHYKLK